MNGEKRHKGAIVFTRHRAEKIAARYEALFLSATARQREDGALWYSSRAVEVIEILQQIRPEWSSECAAVVSAFSPRCTWRDNVRRAVAFATNGNVPTMRTHIDAANRCVAHNANMLKGAKTRAFADAMSGDRAAVVIDTWMMQAAGVDREQPTTGQYRQLSAIVRRLAAKHDVSPRTFQATVWIVARGSSD